jgi:two-component system, cell cycle sensor histidine kinase and response regulator CckA
LKVTDTGVGMDEATAQRIFEPFFTTKREAGGTGLGLASVFGIVKQNGGDISVVSQPGHGSVFTITLPKAQTSVPTENTGLSAGLPDTLQGNVLLMEDMDDLREMLTRILTSRGLSVLSARDGREAVELARETDTQLDLILSDVVMPRMNGPEAVQLIKQHHPGARVIYLSGHADLMDEDFKDEVIWKPIPPETLIRSIHASLNKQTKHQRSERPAA